MKQLVIVLGALALFFGGPCFAETSFEHLRKGVQRITLENGLRIVFYRRTVSPIFTGETWVKVGGVDETSGRSGLAHFLEHMAFKGTSTVGTKDFTAEKELLDELERTVKQLPDSSTALADDNVKRIYQELTKYWIDNEFGRIYSERGGVGLNAATAKDYTNYTVSLPAVAFELWCWMESERLRDPVFRQFYKEREVVLEERRRGYDDNPGGKLYEALLQVSYLSHPNRNPVIGWPSEVSRLTESDMEKFYKEYYRPDNMVIGLVGDLDPNTVLTLVKRYFGRLPKRSDPRPEIRTVEMPQRGQRSVEVRFDAEPQLLMSYHKPVYPNPDDAQFAVLHEILGGGRSSLLHRELVEERQLASSVFSTEAPGERYPSLFVVGGAPKKNVTAARLRDEIQAILDRLGRVPVSDTEIVSAKRRVRVSFIGSLGSNSELASALAKSELFWNDWKQPFEVYEEIEKTTAADLQRLVKSYLGASGRTVATLVKQAGAR